MIYARFRLGLCVNCLKIDGFFGNHLTSVKWLDIRTSTEFPALYGSFSCNLTKQNKEEIYE